MMEEPESSLFALKSTILVLSVPFCPQDSEFGEKHFRVIWAGTILRTQGASTLSTQFTGTSTHDILEKIWFMKQFLCYWKKPQPNTCPMLPLLFLTLCFQITFLGSCRKQRHSWNDSSLKEKKKKKISTILEVTHLWVKEERELSLLKAVGLDDSCQPTLPEERPRTPQCIFPGSKSCLLIYTGSGQQLAKSRVRLGKQDNWAGPLPAAKPWLVSHVQHSEQF